MGARKIEDVPHYTYEEYKLWEGNWELINGVAYAMSPAPMIKHQSISNNIAWELKNILKDCKNCQALLPVDWKIGEDTVLQPDNSVICHEPKNEAYITIAPTIIFEILSKSTQKKDTGLKFDIYEKEGVAYYIIVNPDENMAKVYKLHQGKYIKLSDVSDETVDFEIPQCAKTLPFDFSKIW
jgi:Uma2 family endonuclease